MSGQLGGHLEAALKVGAVSTLCKPFSRDDLRLALEKAFHGPVHGELKQTG